MHPSSVSAKERWTKSSDLRAAVALDPLVDARIRYNLAELRGAMGHVGVQTDMSEVWVPKIVYDAPIQTETSEITRNEVRAQISDLVEQFASERERFVERERLLIAQMNALRDLQARENNRAADFIKFSLTLTAIEFDLSTIQLGYDVVEVIISVLRGGRRDDVVCISETTTLPITSDRGVKITTYPIELHGPRNTGQVSLMFLFTASSRTRELFPLLLGDQMSPPFIPELKEDGLIDRITLTLDRVGIAKVDLLVH